MQGIFQVPDVFPIVNCKRAFDIELCIPGTGHFIPSYAHAHRQRQAATTEPSFRAYNTQNLASESKQRRGTLNVILTTLLNLEIYARVLLHPRTTVIARGMFVIRK